MECGVVENQWSSTESRHRPIYSFKKKKAKQKTSTKLYLLSSGEYPGGAQLIEGVGSVHTVGFPITSKRHRYKIGSGTVAGPVVLHHEHLSIPIVWNLCSEQHGGFPPVFQSSSSLPRLTHVWDPKWGLSEWKWQLQKQGWESTLL